MSLQSCKEHEETLILVASGMADEATAEFLRLHLEDCESCRAELDRLRRMLAAMEDDSVAATMAPPRTLHIGLMKRLRAETQEQRQSPRAISWAETLRSWLRLRRPAWALFALASLAVLILIVVRWVSEVGKLNSAALVTKHEDKPGESGRFAAQPAGPAELRKSLVHSFEDFELALRRNDRLLAKREPVAVPSNARPAEEP